MAILGQNHLKTIADCKVSRYPSRYTAPWGWKKPTVGCLTESVSELIPHMAVLAMCPVRPGWSPDLYLFPAQAWMAPLF